MKKLVYSFLLAGSMMTAESLTCVNKYTSIVDKYTDNSIKRSGDADNGDTHLRLDLIDSTHNYLTVRNEKLELIYLGRSTDKIRYFIEQTSNRNLNLYALFPDSGTLTISKSYNFLGMTDTNVQIVWQCK